MRSKRQVFIEAMKNAIIKFDNNNTKIGKQTALEAIEQDLKDSLEELKQYPNFSRFAHEYPIYENGAEVIGGIVFHSTIDYYLYIREDGAIVTVPFGTRATLKEHIKEIDAKQTITLCGPNAIQLMINAFNKISEIQDDISNYGKSPKGPVVHPGVHAAAR